MSKHLTRARSSECIFLHPTERRTERNGREEDEDENEDGDFDFQPPTPSEPLPHRGARGGAPTFAACAKRTRKKRVPHFRVVRGLALHCGDRTTALTAAAAAAAQMRALFPSSLPPAIVPIPLAKLRRVLRISPRLAVLFARTNTQYPSERECHGQPRANP